MIKYKLICKNCDLKFDSWFASSNEYDKLKKKKLINCHSCGSTNVEKNLMAPKLISKNFSLKNEKKDLMKYQKIKKTINEYQKFIKNNFDFNEKNQMDQSFQLIASCIDKIYSEEEVWATADCTKKEVNDFLEQMNSGQFKLIETFFETMPKLSHTISVTNPKTKVESDVVLEGLASFFG